MTPKGARVKIAIAGAGLTGAYLYRLLKNRGQDPEIFNQKPGTKCGISPCAWGTTRGFTELVAAAGLAPVEYVAQQPDYILMDEIRVSADLMTFEKPKLIRDLLAGAEIKNPPIPVSEYGRIIDASGVCRALLPKIPEDLILPCIQWRIRAGANLENRIKLGKIGYAWCFPLSENEYHIGCGSLISDPAKILNDLGWVSGKGQSDGKVCACKGEIRITGPHASLPFVSEKIWGVGEAIGCVAPLAGDGVVPGMKSVQLLLKCWDDPKGYTRAILKEFSWMKSERRIVDKLRRNLPPSLAEAWVLKKNSVRMGMHVPLKNAAQLLRRLR